MTTKEAVALLERYSNYDGMGIPNLAGCKEAMRVAVDALKEACPELAESEDERIRKLLVWQVYRNIEDETNDLAGSVYDGIKGHDPDLEESIADWKKCLDWLEKQKEPHYTKRNALFDKCVENCDPEVMKKVSDEVDEMLEKERKPISQEDFDTAKHEALWGEQKPAEHSAKGRRGRIGTTPEHIRKKAENFLSKMEPPYDADDICSAYETGAMENANPSWSEEDEKIRQKLIRFISSPNMEGFMLASDEQMFVSWLKSLRSMPKVAVADGTLWKPSEEQMKALEDAFRKDGSDEYRKTINSLYQQLKKLL